MATVARGISVTCRPRRLGLASWSKFRPTEKIGGQDQLPAVNPLEQRFCLVGGGLLLRCSEAFAVTLSVLRILGSDHGIARSADDNAPSADKRRVSRRPSKVALGKLPLSVQVAREGSLLKCVRHHCLSVRGATSDEQSHEKETAALNT